MTADIPPNENPLSENPLSENPLNENPLSENPQTENLLTENQALSHVRKDGTAHMVDVSGKAVTKREACAQAILRTRPDVVAMITDGALPKGDALAVARVAGILAAKQTSSLIPLCHPLPISRVTVDFETGKSNGGAVLVTAVVATTAVTGVEMEALTAASIAALTLYDMIKAVDHTAVITDIRVLAKSGGKSGDWSI